MRLHKNHLSRQSVQPSLGIKLERWHRYCLYAVFGGLFISGAVWLVAHYLLTATGDAGALPHPLEHPAVIFHGACVMIGMFFIGSLMNQHMRRAHRAKRNRISGWGMIVATAALTVTGFGLYYLSNDVSHAVWSWTHSVIGLLLPPLLVWHIMRGRRLKRTL